jgi:hypothetical protein
MADSRARPSTVYSIRSTFRAPLPFVYRWCTDYSPGDPKLAGETGARRVLRRSARTVVYENLEENAEGWVWSRFQVTLHPPDRWTAVALGNYRTWDLDYRLKSLPNGRTELTLRGRRRPVGLGVKNPPRATLEAELRTMWRRYGRALEQEYDRSGGRRRPGGRTPASPTARA